MKKYILNTSFLYTLISITLITICGIAGLLTPSFFPTIYPIYFVSYLIIGIIHLFLLYKCIPSITGSFLRKIGYTFLITLIGALLIIFSYYYFANDATIGIGIASALIAFPFPIVLDQVFKSYIAIPPKNFKQWHYPVGKQLPDMDLLDLSRVLVIQFEFTKNSSESSFTNFRAKAPTSMLFGELFFIFITDYNERNPENKIQFTDKDNQPTGWLFYKKNPWYKRRKFIDYDLTFQANGITDNETIAAVRI